MSVARRFVPDSDRLVRMAQAYAAARAVEGIGGAQVPPERLRMLVDVVAAANRAKSWPTEGAEAARSVALALFSPVLCETLAAQRALNQVLRDVTALPGIFDPPYPKPLLVLQNEVWWLAWLRSAVGVLCCVLALPVLLSVAVLVGTAGQVYRSCPQMPTDGQVVEPDVSPSRGPVTLVNRAMDQFLPCAPFGVVEPVEIVVPGVVVGDLPPVAAYGSGTGSDNGQPSIDGPPTVFDRIFAVLQVAGHEVTPLQLAESLSGSGGQGIAPGLYLSVMLARSPLPPDRPVPRTTGGALALLNWAVAVSELEGDTLPAAEALRAFEESSRPPETVPIGPNGEIFPAVAAGLSGMLLAAEPRFLQFLDTELGPLIFGSPLSDFGFFTEALDPGRYLEVLGRDFPADTPGDTVIAEMESEITAILSGTQHPAPQGWARGFDLLPLLPMVLALAWLVLGLREVAKVAEQTMALLPRRGLMLSLPVAEQASLRAPADLRHELRRLGKTVSLPTLRLDVDATVAASLAQGGFLTPIWLRRKREVVLIVLIRTGAVAEHEPRRAGLWWEALRNRGLAVHLYGYAVHPGHVQPLNDPLAAPVALQELAWRHVGARLVLVTRGDEFAGAAATVAPPAVLALLQSWPDRVVLTPQSVDTWAGREVRLAAAINALVVPYGVSAPRALVRVLWPDTGAPRTRETSPWLCEAPVTGLHGVDWLRVEQDRWERLGPGIVLPPALRLSPAEATAAGQPQAEALTELCGALDWFLGPKGRLWLAACAAYPILRFPLTAWLGTALAEARDWDGVDRAEALARLCRLPWFEAGRMPPWLREALLSRLNDQDRAVIEQVFARFYAEWDPASANSRSAEDASLWRLRAEFDPDMRERLDGMDKSRTPSIVEPRPTPQERLERVRRTMLADRGLLLVGAAAVSLELWRAWPDRTALPLPPGAWLRVAAVSVFALAGLAVVVVALRRRKEA